MYNQQAKVNLETQIYWKKQTILHRHHIIIYNKDGKSKLRSEENRTKSTTPMLIKSTEIINFQQKDS